MSNDKFDLLGRLIALLTTISQAWGVLVDFAEKLNSKEGPRWAEEFARFLRKEPTWIRRWYEEDGVIYFEVTSDGTSGPAWIERLEKKGFLLSKWAKYLLNSPDFKASKAGTLYKIAVLKGIMFSDNDRITSKIRVEAERRKLEKPNAEVACLIREMFSDEELEAMGLWWIVVFHESIKDSDGDSRLLGTYRNGDGGWLDTCCDRPGYGWVYYGGFAFVAPQVSL